MDRGVKPVENQFSLNKLRLFIGSKENVLNNFKSKIFPIKSLDEIPIREPGPE